MCLCVISPISVSVIISVYKMMMWWQYMAHTHGTFFRDMQKFNVGYLDKRHERAAMRAHWFIWLFYFPSWALLFLTSTSLQLETSVTKMNQWELSEALLSQLVKVRTLWVTWRFMLLYTKNEETEIGGQKQRDSINRTRVASQHTPTCKKPCEGSKNRVVRFQGIFRPFLWTEH